MAERKSSKSGKSAKSSTRSRSGSRTSNSSSGFPSWGLYAIGGLAIAGIVYGLSKYGPTSETISGWVESAGEFVGLSDDDVDEFADDDFDEEEEGTTSATGSSSYGSAS